MACGHDGLTPYFLPWWLVLAAAAAFWFGHDWLNTELFNTPVLWWTGLSPVAPISNDFVPLFPWFCAPLLGIATAKLATKLNLFESMKGIEEGSIIDNSLGFIGRHSLIYYMIHQPVMLGLLWAFTTIIGPPDRTPVFLHNCTKSCTTNNDAAFCEKFCTCTADGLKREKLFTPFHEGKVDLSTDPTAQNIINQCSVE